MPPGREAIIALVLTPWVSTKYVSITGSGPLPIPEASSLSARRRWDDLASGEREAER